MHKEFYWRNLLENVHLEDEEGDGKIILSVICCEYVICCTGWGSCSMVVGLSVEFSGSATTVLDKYYFSGSYEHSNEPSGSRRAGNPSFTEFSYLNSSLTNL
jgi:hypothetical protein